MSSRYFAHFIPEGGGATVGDDFSLDAVLLKTQSGSLGLDAIIRVGQTGSYGLDAVLRLVQSGSYGLDAVIQSTQTGSATFDAVFRSTQSSTLALDAVLEAVQSDSFSLDAVVQAAPASFTLDAIVRATGTDSFSLDAVLSASGPTLVTRSFSLDAYLATASGRHDRTEAHVETQDDTVITVSGVSGYADGTLLSVVLADMFSRAAAMEGAHLFGLNAEISAPAITPQSDSFGLDARLAYGSSFGLSGVIGSVEKTTFGLDAALVGGLGNNIVASPLGGATVSYTSSHNYSCQLPEYAANGVLYPEYSLLPDIYCGEGWAASPYTAGATWWQVTWTLPQSLDRVVLYDYAAYSGYFGNGRLIFSDASEVPFTGLPHQRVDAHTYIVGGNLVLTFARKTGIMWMRVISDSGGVAPAGLHEVQAYDTTQWED